MFERKPLRDDVAAEILGRIIDGRIPSGSRINESHLSAELGISRTPLREAMLCLATDGALASDMGRGFRVPHLSGREASDLVSTLAVLLAAAARATDWTDPNGRIELGNMLSRARMQVEAPAAFCERFYLLTRQLVDHCPNAVLREESLRLARITLRYLFEGLNRGYDPRDLIERIDEAVKEGARGRRAEAADALEHALRAMARDLAVRFPAEVATRT